MAAFASEIEELVQRGIAAAREQRNGVAQQLLRKAVELAPTHEQAWLWLSGVEETTPAKIEALRRVLAINPDSALAQRGLDQLQLPKAPLDLAAIAATTSAAPAPARAAHVALAPPVRAPQLPLEIEPADAVATSSISLNSLDELRPALEHAKKRNRFLPRTSELVIMGVLLLMLAGSIIGVRIWLNRSSNQFNSAQARIDRTLQMRTEVPVTIQPAIQPPVAQPTTPPAPVNPDSRTSRTYNLSLGGASIDEASKTLSLNVTLSNPLQRTVSFRSGDFALRNSANARLTLNPRDSTLLMQGAQIAPGGSITGQLVFSGDVSRRPMTLTWRPTGGGIQQEIPVQ